MVKGKILVVDRISRGIWKNPEKKEVDWTWPGSMREENSRATVRRMSSLGREAVSWSGGGGKRRGERLGC